MDTQVVGILGTALSALIAALKYRAKVRHDTLRTTKAALFYLLEIRHFVLRLHQGNTTFPNEYISHIERLLAKEGVKLSDLDRANLVKSCKPVFRNFVNGHISSSLTELIKPYCQTLNELARDDPILAFYLKGKESLGKLINIAIDHMGQVVESSKAELPVETSTALQAGLEDVITEFALNDLTNAVKKVAFKCGFLTYLRCILILNRSCELEPLDMARFDTVLRNGLQELLREQRKDAVSAIDL